ncbi:MAG TPA: glycosyltransferase family 4 protein [Candidatus Binataceae bacterium]|nr:glycosyltransferase family 4 protein [Candidatus Binataceae bacterium]
MSILGVDPERRFGGGEVQVMGLTLGLLAAGHRAELLCDPTGELWQRATGEGVVCHPLRVRNSIDVAAGLRLRAMLSRKAFDVVHFHTARAHALAPYARGRAGALVVTRRMDYLPNRLFAPWLYNRAVEGIAAISGGVADALVRGGVARKRIKIVASGVDCRRFAPPTAVIREQTRSALGLLPDDVAIGAVGALVPRKGHHVLVEAMTLAQSQAGEEAVAAHGRLHCFLAGDGPLYADLAREVAQSGLSRTVHLMRAVNDPRNLLAALDVFVMPSLSEGLGIAALEAMASGLPVIASAVGGLREVVSDGINGILVAPGDAPALAAAIIKLASDSMLRSKMGSAGRKRVRQDFAMETMVDRTLELYSSSLVWSYERKAKG